MSSSRRCAMNSCACIVASFSGRLGVAVADVEVEDVRVGSRSNQCASEERARRRAPGSWRPRRLGPRRRRHGDLRLGLRDPLRILVDGREVLDPGQTAREVLVLEENLRRRACRAVC